MSHYSSVKIFKCFKIVFVSYGLKFWLTSGTANSIHPSLCIKKRIGKCGDKTCACLVLRSVTGEARTVHLQKQPAG